MHELIVLPPPSHLKVQTSDSFYNLSCQFERAYFKFIPINWVQGIRLVYGLVVTVLIVEEIYVGPTDTLLTAAYLSFWGLVASFLTFLFQFKACNYELEKAAATDKSKYPYS